MLLLWSPIAAAHPPDEADDASAGEEIEVVDHGAHGSASAVHLDAEEIVAQPARSTDDLLRAMPGLQVSAHGGRGKAYQYLLRGFDAVHGADVGVSVDGVVLNEPSNVHGHGYLDLHLVPLALVRAVELAPGSYDPRQGDFHTAAGVRLALGVPDEGLTVQVGGGTDRSGLARLTWRPVSAAPGTFLHADVDAGLGVVDGRGWRQARIAAGSEHTTGPITGRLTLLGYDGQFQSAGLLREDQLAAGAARFWDAQPGAGGGRSTRALGIGVVDVDLDRVQVHAQASAGLRWLDLIQNYTGTWRYPDTGDAVRQTHRAWTLGARLDTSWRPAITRDRLILSSGVELRADLATQTEAHVDAEGSPWQRHGDADVRHVDLAGWAAVDARPTRHWTLKPGLRVDGLWIDHRSRLDALQLAVDDPRWGRASGVAVSPKVQTSVHPVPALDLLAAWGRGFRSPEARGIADGAPAPITQTETAEVGLRLRHRRALELQGTAFATWLDNEIVFDHIQARYLSTGATRRLGGEGVLTVRPIEGFELQGQLSYADGRYLASAEPIPYAPRWMGSASVTALQLPVGPTRWTATVRARVLGPRPLPAGFRARTAVAGDVTLRVAWRRLLFDLDLDNAFFNRWRDGQFVFPSRWDNGPRSDLPAGHFTAGDPTALRLTLGWRL